MEDEIEQLPHGAGPNSFRVLAEWLRDNRQMLEKRLDRQDRKLEEIHSETRKTNGRVTDLEKSVDMAEALADGRKEWSHEQDEHRQDRVNTRLTLLMAGCTLAGGFATAIGHVVGLW